MSAETLREHEGIRRREEVLTYCRRIRNLAKRSYAIHYGAWREYGTVPGEPIRPTELSFMAAQAVRMEIDTLRRKWGEVCR